MRHMLPNVKINSFYLFNRFESSRLYQFLTVSRCNGTPVQCSDRSEGILDITTVFKKRKQARAEHVIGGSPPALRSLAGSG